jgi:hypothetical protein
MARISSSFSMGNWKTRMTTTMSLGMGMTPPQERRKTTVGTLTTELKVMTVPPVMTALEMMVATWAVVTEMSAQVLRSSVVGS